MGKLLDKAILFSMQAHEGQVRKAGKKPYVLHPMEAAVIAGTLTNDENVLAAALLHDVVEDAGVTPQEIKEQFGDRVAELVASETENKRAGTPPAETWLDRKLETLAILRDTDDEGIKILWLSDKLSNLRSMFSGVKEQGDEFFNNFNQKDKKMHEWYYRTIAEYLGSLKDTAAYGEFMFLIGETFK